MEEFKMSLSVGGVDINENRVFRTTTDYLDSESNSIISSIVSIILGTKIMEDVMKGIIEFDGNDENFLYKNEMFLSEKIPNASKILNSITKANIDVISNEDNIYKYGFTIYNKDDSFTIDVLIERVSLSNESEDE